MSDDEGFLDWLSASDASPSISSRKPGNNIKKKAVPQSAMTVKEAGRIALLGLCCQGMKTGEEGGFKKYKTKKLVFTGAELTGWIALHIFFAPQSTEETRNLLLLDTVTTFLRRGLVSVEGEESTQGDMLEVKQKGLYRVNEEELLLGIQQNLQSSNIRMALDVLSGSAIPKAEDGESTIDWKQMKTKLLAIEDSDKDDIVFYFHQDGNTQRKLVAAASLERLIERLANVHQPESLFRDAFLLTYHTFISTTKLLDILTERWNHKPNIDHFDRKEIKEFVIQNTKTIQIRVLNFIKLWIETYPHTLDDSSVNLKASCFFEKIKETYPNAYRTITQSITNMKQKYIDINNELSMPEPEIPFSWSDADYKLIAEQLTLVDSYYFSRIFPEEFLGESWKKKDKNVAVNLKLMLERYDRLNDWMSSLCLALNMKDRVNAIINLVQLGQHLLELNNFFSLSAIVTTLTSDPVQRLARTWEKLPQDTLTNVNYIREQFASIGSYKQSTINSTTCVPFINYILRDLSLVEQSAEDYEGDLINFRKRTDIGIILSEVRKFQVSGYIHLSIDKELFNKMVHIPVDKHKMPFLEYSKRIEPDEPEDLVENLLISQKLMQEDIDNFEHQLARYLQDIENLKAENDELESNKKKHMNLSSTFG